MNLIRLDVTLTGRFSDGNFICRIKTSTCTMFPERRFISSSPTFCHACATTTGQQKKVGRLLTSGTKSSWPLLSRSIGYLKQFFDKLLRYSTPWFVTGVRIVQWSYDHRPHYHPVKGSATISEVSYRCPKSTQMLKYALGCFISSNSFGRMEFYPTWEGINKY